MTDGTRRRLFIEDIKPDRRTVLKLSAMGVGAALIGTGSQQAAAQDASPEASAVAGTQFAYVGSDSRSQMVEGTPVAEPIGISVYSIDPATGALTSIQTLPSDNSFFFAFDADQSHLYAVKVIGDYNGGTNGSVEAYARDAKQAC